jgi:hypothetical protein
MKSNRKNRKLTFIRTKNNLRTGKVKFYCYAKVSNEVDIDEKYCEYFLNVAKKSLFDTYKLKLHFYDTFKGTEGLDFIKDLTTVRIRLSKYPFDNYDLIA